ncbi:hypothetical protein AWH63_10845 [Marinobacter sp. C18]|uniref:hypothetical protein n=1 Tax=Marinobacter sp. C18 TaxID=1772288 RepID=UPI0009489338|nr:hypothetical protein [Marinobacter sp. C18]OLF82028.1 hypothetical protein AWH63_10845 [Marinobacter sp. C18]
MTIKQIDNNTFEKVAGANTMTLKRDRNGGWEMLTSNPSTRAWNGNMPSFRRFESLAAVEQHYKSWRGVTHLIADHTQPQRG